MANTIGWGQGSVNNENGWGKGGENSENNWGQVYANSPAGDTNIGVSSGLDGFIFNVQATDSQFTLPLVSTGNYDFDLYVDDVLNTAGITVYNQPETTIYLGDTLSHKIELRGQIEGWSVSNNSERNKIYDIENWGTLRFSGSTTTSKWFFGCQNLTVSATDSPDFTNSTSGFYMFRGCSSLLTLNSPLWDLSSFTTMNGAFHSCSVLNDDFSGITTSSLCTNYLGTFQSASLFNSNLNGFDFSGINVTMGSMFRSAKAFNGTLNWSQVGNAATGAFSLMFNDADAFNQDISSMVFNTNTKVTGNFILNNGSAFSIANYDAFLIALEAQVAASGGTLDNGNIRIDANYSLLGAAQTAHVNLTTIYGWTLTDAGGV